MPPDHVADVQLGHLIVGHVLGDVAALAQIGEQGRSYSLPQDAGSAERGAC